MQITIPITEYDIEEFKDLVDHRLEDITWSFPTDDRTEQVSVKFVKAPDDSD